MVSSKVALSVLLGLTQKFTSDEPLEEILQAVTDAALRLLPGDHSSLRVFNEAHTELLCGARSGKGASARPMVFRPGEGVVGWVAESGWVAYISDTSKDHRFKAGADQGFGIGSMLAVPLLSAGKVVGVLSSSAPTADAFTAEDEALALLLANTTVPIIERARLERLALVDELTQVFNDRYLLPRLRDEVGRARRTSSPLTVCVLDVDHLKAFNRDHSFKVGDRLLQRVADRMRALLPSFIRIVRRGGGTFVLLMPHTDEAAGLAHIERVREDIAHQAISVDNSTRVTQTVSAGLATWDREERPLALLQRADAAMRDAKAAGRNRCRTAPQCEPKSYGR